MTFPHFHMWGQSEGDQIRRMRRVWEWRSFNSYRKFAPADWTMRWRIVIMQQKTFLPPKFRSFSLVKRIVFSKFICQDPTVNSEFYCDILRCLRQDMRRKWPELQREKSFLLYRDNAPFHSWVCTCKFLTKNSITVILYLTYSPYLAPCGFMLFPCIGEPPF